MSQCPREQTGQWECRYTEACYKTHQIDNSQSKTLEQEILQMEGDTMAKNQDKGREDNPRPNQDEQPNEDQETQV